MTPSPANWIIGIIDKKYKHPGAGRYTAFSAILGLSFVQTPIKFRYFCNPTLNKLEFYIFHLLGRKGSADRYPYSLGLFVQEISCFLKMLTNPRSVFHSVKGETDMHNLPVWSRYTGARLVATFHDDLEQFTTYWPKVHFGIDRLYLRNFDGIIALCESQKRYFSNFVDPARIRVIYHGVNTAFFRPSQTEPEHPTVICVGSYCRDYSTLIAAIPRVFNVLPHARFILLGLATQPDEMPEQMEDPRVSYVDGVSDCDLLSLYQGSTLAAISLWAATANNALLEAMSCGLPVVATNIGGIPEYLGSNAGILVPQSDPVAFADGILQILTDSERAYQMGVNARLRAVEMFDYQVVAEAARVFYQEVRQWPQAPAPLTSPPL